MVEKAKKSASQSLGVERRAILQAGADRGRSSANEVPSEHRLAFDAYR